MISLSRRSFLAGLFCAPAIIRPGLLMPVNPALAIGPGPRWYGYYDIYGDTFSCAPDLENLDLLPHRFHVYDMGEVVSAELNKFPLSEKLQAVTSSFIESLGVLGDRGVKWMGPDGPYPAWAWPYKRKKYALTGAECSWRSWR